MPELPEVETTCRGIRPHIQQQPLTAISVRQPKLRYPVPEATLAELQGQTLLNVSRRSKYILLDFSSQRLIVHLGMSGSLRIVTEDSSDNADWRKHDHWQLTFNRQVQLRYHDPRRFGFMVSSAPHAVHPFLAKLGVEPLSDDFTVAYLFTATRHKRTAIKQLIMNASVVVGVGNIYASESLFSAGIHPLRPAGSLSEPEAAKLHNAIQQIIRTAIEQGGTTLKDFVNPQGQPGYFAQQLAVYGKTGDTCLTCQQPIHKQVIAGRSSFFCPNCQPLNP